MSKEFCKRGHDQSVARKVRLNGKRFCYECEKIMRPIRYKKWCDRSKDKIAKNNRKWHLKRNYGITTAEWDSLFLAQQGQCAACHRTGVRLVVDHNHTTKQLRGLLCDNCNCAIGLVHESKTKLIQLINYLGTHHV